MTVKIIDDPFDRIFSYGLKYIMGIIIVDGKAEKYGSSYDYILGRLSIINYRVLKDPRYPPDKSPAAWKNIDVSYEEEFKRGDLITREDVYLLSL